MRGGQNLPPPLPSARVKERQKRSTLRKFVFLGYGGLLLEKALACTGEVTQHVRTCRDTLTPRFSISETAWSIVYKFGMWVGGH